MTDKPKRPKDANQLAKQVADLATMDADEREALQKEVGHKEKSNKTHPNQSPGKRGKSSSGS